MRRTTMAIVLSVAVAGGWSACGRTPASPTPSPQTPPNPPSFATFSVSGKVTDSGFPLSGVTVTASEHGTTTYGTTRANGSYAIANLAGPVQLQVAVDGFNPSTQSVTVTSNTTVNFALSPTAPPLDISGTWTVTFSPSPDCAATLPDDTRQRAFEAVITQRSTTIVFQLFGATIPNPPSVTDGRIFGNAFSIELLENDLYYGYVVGSLVERLAPTRWLGVFGTVTGTATSTAIPGVFFGRFDYFETPTAADFPHNPPTATCDGMNGSATFQRAATSAVKRLR